MAGAAIAAPMRLTNPGAVVGTLPIKSAEVVNQCDLVGIDTSGQVVVASKTTGAIVKALYIAFFEDENGMATSRTGVAGLTVKTGLCKRAKLIVPASNAATLVPSIDEGKPVFLGPVSTSTVSNYTCARTTTDGDKVQQVGEVFGKDANGDWILDIDLTGPQTDFLFQTAATSTTIYG